MVVNSTMDAFYNVVPEFSVSICPLCFIQGDHVAVSKKILYFFHLWADRAVEFELLVIYLSSHVLVAHLNLLLDMVDSVNIEGTIYRERFLTEKAHHNVH